MNEGCPKHPTFDRDCVDIRCLRNWTPEGAPSPEEQLTRWAAGNPVCPNSRHECCPDFSCCKPHIAWPLEKRRRFIEADAGTREKMSMGALGALVSASGVNAYVTRGEPTDRE